MKLLIDSKAPIRGIDHAKEVADAFNAGFENAPDDERWTAHVEPSPDGRVARVIVKDEEGYTVGGL